MLFDSEDKAYEFYNRYGGRVGFSVRNDNAYKNKHTNELISRMFVCYKRAFTFLTSENQGMKQELDVVRLARTSCEGRDFVSNSIGLVANTWLYVL